MKLTVKRIFSALILALSAAAFFACTKADVSPVTTVRVAMPANEQIQDVDTNYYKCWLEQQTGLDIEISFIPKDYTEEYLRLLFSSNEKNIDAVFFNSASGFPSAKLIQEYGRQGYLMPLEDKINAASTNMGDVLKWFKTYDLQSVLTATDGHIYYMPSLDTSTVKRNAQTLWINAEWLKNLKLSMPQTTEDLKAILQAFQDKDPNGNGMMDEIPLASTGEDPSEQVCNYLINSFVYNDPKNSRMAVQNGRVYFTPTTEEWRQAITYCHGLYSEGLLKPQCFTFSKDQLKRLVNDPRNLIGGFTSNSITDVLLQSSPELMSRYVHISPLKGPSGMQYACVNTTLPAPGGVILAACENPQAVYKLMDVMVSEQASLIGRYGEQGSDWDFAINGDISPNGSPASIAVKNKIANKRQSKHLLEMGPFVTREKYVDGVAWRGFQADQEYMDARAARVYRQFEPKEYIKTILFQDNDTETLEQIRTRVDDYTNSSMTDFITGVQNPEDDTVWDAYLKRYEQLELNTLIRAVQDSYDTLSQ